VEIPGGRGVIKDPLGTEIPKEWGDANQKTFRGRGMDIFWNHTFSKSAQKSRFVNHGKSNNHVKSITS